MDEFNGHEWDMEELRRREWRRMRGTDRTRAAWVKGTRSVLRRAPGQLDERERALIDDLERANADLTGPG